jgi:nucleotide-binding universal stress UspA family protein
MRPKYKTKNHAVRCVKFRTAARGVLDIPVVIESSVVAWALLPPTVRGNHMFNRILVPTDFSPPSDAALEYARILAAKFGSTLRILHVVDDPSSASEFVSDGFAPSTEEIQTALTEHARKRLEHLMTAVDRMRYHAYTDAVVGQPAAAIIDYAGATGTSLIVMGTHGRTGLAHLLMGSVAEQVVRTAPCPVLTVRQVAVADEAVANVARDYCEVRMPIAV